MDKEQCVRGFKVFNSDWICNPRPGISKQYTCPGRFQEDGEIKGCGHGMHFCKKAADCFGYYDFNPEYRVAEVVARGEVKESGNKCCTNDLEIVQEISWQELLEIVNTGKACTGCGNSGDRNSGHYNSGNSNSGNRNAGSHNSGDDNSGKWNSGNNNIGYGNSGNNNKGDDNSGNCNRGDRNSGDWNKCNSASGCFNTKTPKIYLFNKPSEWTYRDWRNSEAYYILKNVVSLGLFDFPQFSDVIDSDIENEESWWDDLTSHEKKVIKNLPNFDAAIFKEITGIDVDADERKIWRQWNGVQSREKIE